MTEPTTVAPETDPAATAAAVTADPAKPAKKSLEDSLADIDEGTRAFILGEVTSARTEAKNLRTRLKEVEPKVNEYDRLVEAGKDKETRLQEAAQAAEERATAAVQRVARAEVKAALTGVVDNPDVVIKRLDMSQFLTTDGEVDTEAVDALRGEWAAIQTAAAAPRQPKPDASQASGANGSAATDPRAVFGSFIQDQIRRPA